MSTRLGKSLKGGRSHGSYLDLGPGHKARRKTSTAAAPPPTASALLTNRFIAPSALKTSLKSSTRIAPILSATAGHASMKHHYHIRGTAAAFQEAPGDRQQHKRRRRSGEMGSAKHHVYRAAGLVATSRRTPSGAHSPHG